MPPVTGLLLCLFYWLAGAYCLSIDPSDDWQLALQNADDGAEVSVAPGIYRGSASISKHLTLAASGEAGSSVFECQNDRCLSLNPGSSVTVSGINFRSTSSGCFSLLNANLTISSAELQCSGTESGASISAHFSRVLLQHVHLCNPSAPGSAMAAGASLVLNGTTLEAWHSSFWNFSSAGLGGAILATGSSVRLHAVVGSGNQALLGGGFLAAQYSSISISGTRGSVADEAGGTENAAASLFTDNSAVGSNGGFANLLGGRLEVSQGVRISGNTAVSGGGLAAADTLVVLSGGAKGEWFGDAGGVVLDLNSAVGLGGGFDCAQRCQVFVTGAVDILGNMAARGGGVHISTPAGTAGIYTSLLQLAGPVRVMRNVASEEGGGITFSAGLVEVGAGVEFIENRCVRGGCAMFTAAAIVRVNSASFLRNSGVAAGGLACWASYLELKNSKFVDNFSQFLVASSLASAECMAPSHGADILAGNSFTGGIAATDGGAIFTNCPMRIHGGNEISNCRAARGAAIFAIFAHVELIAGSGPDEKIIIRDNVAETAGAGLAFMQGVSFKLSGVQVLNNRVLDSTSFVSGGGVYFQGIQGEVNNCSISHNSAKFGGGIGAQSDGRMEIQHSVVESCTAENGGGIFVGDSAHVTMNNSLVHDCQAVQGAESESGRGGGIHVSGAATLSLHGSVRIAHCSATSGGGVQVQGAGMESHGELEIYKCSATQQGGGLVYMAPVGFAGPRSVVRFCSAAQGGGIHGLGAEAVLRLENSHTMTLSHNSAELDGGGMLLAGSAQLILEPESCPRECGRTTIGDGSCLPFCMHKGCNWDSGDCNAVFDNAGVQGLGACERSQCTFAQWESTTVCTDNCFKSTCDWSLQNQGCTRVRSDLRSCPIFDAMAYVSSIRTPNLTFVEGGLVEGYGRCMDSTECDRTATTEHPGGQCGTINDGGRHIKIECLTCPGTVDLGPGWGYCASKPRLPSFGFDYEPQDMIDITEMPWSDLLMRYPGCGDVPLVFENNKANRNGGGIAKAGCDGGLVARGLCFVGNLAPASLSATMVRFSGNEAAGSGGAIYTTCKSLGPCEPLLRAEMGFNSALSPNPPPLVLNFYGNLAAAYGRDVASAPLKLVLLRSMPGFVPGVSALDLDVALQDSTGQEVKGSVSVPSPYLLEIKICPHGVLCSAIDSLQSVDYKSMPPLESVLKTAAASSALTLQYCLSDQNAVDVHVSLSSDDSDGDDELEFTISVDCLPCQQGQSIMTKRNALGQETWTCVVCASDEYSTSLSQSDPAVGCQPCPLGASSPCFMEGAQVETGNDQSLWEQVGGVYRLQSCPKGYVLVRDDQAPVLQQCVLCPFGKYSLAAGEYASRTQVSSTATNASDYCEPCPREADCLGGDEVITKQGYWSTIVVQSQQRRQLNSQAVLKLYRCSVDLCLGNNTCAEGQTGPICGVCDTEKEYYQAGPVCKKCADESNQSWSALWIILLLLFFMTFWYATVVAGVFDKGSVEDAQQPQTEGDTQEQSAGILKRAYNEFKIFVQMIAARLILSQFQDHVKIFISFIQITSTFSNSFVVGWPAELTSFWSTTSVMRLNFFEWEGPHCLLSGNSWYYSLQLVTLVPIAFSLALGLPCIYLMATGRRASATYKLAKKKFFHAFLLWTYLIYPVVASLSVQGFHCKELGDQHLLASDLRIVCPFKGGSSAHLAWTIFATIVLPIGIPVLMYALLRFFKVPDISMKKRKDGILHAVILKYRDFISMTLAGQIAAYLGHSSKGASGSRLLAQRAKQMFENALPEGQSSLSVNMLVAYLNDLGISGHDEAEVAQLFLKYDTDGNGVLDWQEFHQMCQLIVREKGWVTGLETIETISDEHLLSLCRFGWRDAVNREEDALLRFSTFKSELIRRYRIRGERCLPGSGSSRSMAALGQENQRSNGHSVDQSNSNFGGSRGSRGMMARSRSTRPTAQDWVRDMIGVLPANSPRENIIDWILRLGKELISKGIMDSPRLRWNGELGKEEVECLSQVGFLFAGFEVRYWQMELIELGRKFVMTVLVVLLFQTPTVRLLAGLIATMVALLFFLRTMPYGVPSLNDSQIMALATQALTLLYGLIVSIDEFSAFTGSTGDWAVRVKTLSRP